MTIKTDVASQKILIVEHDPATRSLIHSFLKQSKENYQIQSIIDGRTALAVFDQFQPDLVILDVISPDTTGFKLCQQMKSRMDVMVMLLTSLTDVKSQIAGLETADAYVTKPFYVEVLEKQVVELLQGTESSVHTPAKYQAIVVGDLVIDPASRGITLNDKLVSLTALEFDVLYFLATHPNRVWRRGELMQELWGHEDRGGVDVPIARICRKIEQDPSQPKYIKTVRGVGYKIVIPEVFHNPGD